MSIKYDQFTDEFINKFSEDGFYAAPNRTKIYITFNGQRKLVGNAIVANLEQVYEKIPVYSYNSPLYNKYLKGKEVVTGVLALRKITIAQFISMKKLGDLNEKIETEITKLRSELEKLKQVFGKENRFSGLEKIIVQKNIMLKKLEKIKNNNAINDSTSEESVINYLSVYNKTLYEMENLNKDISEDLFSKDDLLYHLERSNNKISIDISFEGNLGDDVCPFIGLKDVLFTKKRTEINVSRGDIIEVYDFIGNPKHNKEKVVIDGN